MRMIRSIALLAATAVVTSLSVLSAGCGASASKETAADVGGGGGGGEGGGSGLDASTDAAPKHPKPGPDSGSSSSDDAGDGGVACSLETTALAPHGTQLVPLSGATIDGVTSDGYVVYTDTSSNTNEVISLDGGAPTSIGANDGTGGAFTSGLVVFAFNGVSQTTEVGTLSIWSSAHGQQSIGTEVIAASPGQGLLDISGDGTHIVYFDNAAGTTGDVTVINTDGSGKTVIAPGLDISSISCFPAVYFAGAYVVVETCAAGSDGGSSSTLTTYTGTGWMTKAVLSTTVDASSYLVVDPTGASLQYLSAAGLQVASLASGMSVTVDPMGTPGSFTSDGQHVVYTTMGGAINLGAITGAAPTPLVATGGYEGIYGLSPDNNWLLAFTTLMQDSAGDYVSDLYLASASSAGSATTLASSASASLFGDLFTADSTHAMFDNSVSNGSGTLTAAAIMGGSRATLGPLSVLNLSATGGKIVFNTNDTPCGGSSGAADLEVVDTSSSTTPTLLVTQADAYFFLDSAKQNIVYSWSYLPNASAGIWVLPIP